MHAMQFIGQAEGVGATWDQSTDEVFLRVPVPADVKGRDIEFEIHPKRLRLAAKARRRDVWRFNKALLNLLRRS